VASTCSRLPPALERRGGVPVARGSAASWLFRFTAKPHFMLEHSTALRCAA